MPLTFIISLQLLRQNCNGFYQIVCSAPQFWIPRVNAQWSHINRLVRFICVHKVSGWGLLTNKRTAHTTLALFSLDLPCRKQPFSKNIVRWKSFSFYTKIVRYAFLHQRNLGDFRHYWYVLAAREESHYCEINKLSRCPKIIW